jgi:hypothetical protein
MNCASYLSSTSDVSLQNILGKRKTIKIGSTVDLVLRSAIAARAVLLILGHGDIASIMYVCIT